MEIAMVSDPPVKWQIARDNFSILILIEQHQYSSLNQQTILVLLVSGDRFHLNTETEASLRNVFF
jgi:hypothetical protein